MPYGSVLSAICLVLGCPGKHVETPFLKILLHPPKILLDRIKEYFGDRVSTSHRQSTTRPIVGRERFRMACTPRKHGITDKSKHASFTALIGSLRCLHPARPPALLHVQQVLQLSGKNPEFGVSFRQICFFRVTVGSVVIQRISNKTLARWRCTCTRCLQVYQPVRRRNAEQPNSRSCSYDPSYYNAITANKTFGLLCILF